RPVLTRPSGPVAGGCRWTARTPSGPHARPGRRDRRKAGRDGPVRRSGAVEDGQDGGPQVVVDRPVRKVDGPGHDALDRADDGPGAYALGGGRIGDRKSDV